MKCYEMPSISNFKNRSAGVTGANKYMADSDLQSKTTVSPDVLITIARLSALSVPGVSRMAQVPGGVNRLFKRGIGDGVRMEVKNNVVRTDLYLILKENVNIREVSRNVQSQVARALQEMVGMEIGGIEIHIEDIDMEEDVEARSA
jgi:uncharacterized alkaline shock family protein YloU